MWQAGEVATPTGTRRDGIDASHLSRMVIVGSDVVLEAAEPIP
jgi:hypothetical protein